jgi:hypothetical protein
VLSFGAEYFVFQVAIQKYKFGDKQNLILDSFILFQGQCIKSTGKYHCDIWHVDDCAGMWVKVVVKCHH